MKTIASMPYNLIIFIACLQTFVLESPSLGLEDVPLDSSIKKFERMPTELEGSWKLSNYNNLSYIFDTISPLDIGTVYDFSNNELNIDGTPSCMRTGQEVSFYEILERQTFSPEGVIDFNYRLAPVRAASQGYDNMILELYCLDKDGIEVTKNRVKLQRSREFAVFCKDDFGIDTSKFEMFHFYTYYDEETIIANNSGLFTCFKKNTEKTAPIANAGEDIMALSSATITLDGSQSEASNGGELSYAWMQVSGANVSFESTTELISKIKLPQVNEKSEIVISLTVSEGGSSVTDHVSIFVSANQPPNIAIDAPVSVNAEEVVIISSLGSTDAEEDELSFSWVQKSGPNVIMDTSVAGVVQFVAPMLPNDSFVVINLSLTDGLAFVEKNIEIKIIALVDPFDALLNKINDHKYDGEVEPSTAKLLTKIVVKAKNRFEKGKIFQAKLYMKTFNFLTGLFSLIGKIEDTVELDLLASKVTAKING